MIAILIFLLIITVSGTVLHVYLRKEQDKLIPKNKYDEVRDEVLREKREKLMVDDLLLDRQIKSSIGSRISLGCGVLSCLIFVGWLFSPFNFYFSSVNFMGFFFIGSIAALSGLLVGIGVFGIPNAIMHVGVILCIIGLITNIPYAIFMTFIFIVSHGAW
jgi:hypothetical protein